MQERIYMRLIVQTSVAKNLEILCLRVIIRSRTKIMAFWCVAMLQEANALLQFVRNAMQFLSIIIQVVEGGPGLDRTVWLINPELTQFLITFIKYYLLAYWVFSAM